jgi:hypothetical protein
MLKHLLIQAIVVSGMTSVCWSCDGDIPKIRQEMPYKEARQLLLDAGWQGINFWILGPEKNSPTEYVWAELGYKEVSLCAGIGRPSACAFEFRNSKGEKLVVTTDLKNEIVLEHWTLTEN